MIISKTNILIGIIGAGTMGSGIAQVAATAEYRVFIFDDNKDAVVKAKNGIQDSLNKLRQKKKITDTECKEIFSRIIFADRIEMLSGCNFILEAIVEEISAKQNLFRILERLVSTEAILATNTSSLSITSIAEALIKKERLIGAHFFNPPVLMPLVEIVPAKNTSQETIDFTRELIGSWGKTTVICKDTPGFIVNRVARPFYLEALRILEEGTADVRTIDDAMKEIGGFKMGPFELMDLIGNDINYKVTEMIFIQTNNDLRYEPSKIQKEMVEKNLLGRKSGKGFYDYNNPAQSIRSNEDKILKEKIFMRIVSVIINEAADLVLSETATIQDIDKAMRLGVSYPKGPLLWADELGIDKIVAEIQSLYGLQKKERYKVSSLLIKMNKYREKFYVNQVNSLT
ncbi:MAG: 3-hydroxyacyl-CoA dehydrogenase NAD-binding domain-containing protein [Ignavibacteriales bacterium]|nr:3-hydroxyacyl-CoA dehydrogenase NAD-binding domain-containing protein [Ignavibacteriales bacterium]